VSVPVNPWTFQLNDSGVILNDDTVPGVPFVDVTDVVGLSSAPYRATKRDHEGVDGGFMDAEFETGRDIVITGVAYSQGNSLDVYLDSLKANFAPSTVLLPFYFVTRDGALRVLFVKPLGVSYSVDTAFRTGEADIQISMYAEDPRIYDYALQAYVLPVGAINFSGFGFNLGFNFGFGGSSVTSDGQYVVNGGNRPTPPILTFTGPLTNPRLLNDNVGKELDFTVNLVDNTFLLVVDTQYHTVRLNGANARATLTGPGWFHLLAGQNFLRLRADSGTGTVTVQYRNAWR
jgi:hypothetical protein